eukprot:7666738-Lingulodinium_polyedra.AAC.1
MPKRRIGPRQGRDEEEVFVHRLAVVVEPRAVGARQAVQQRRGGRQRAQAEAAVVRAQPVLERAQRNSLPPVGDRLRQRRAPPSCAPRRP